jgi:ADP-ribosyl-[dinitrogen reductase] hydrolase
MTQEHVQPHPLLGLAIGDALGKPFESVEGKPPPSAPSADWNLDYLPGCEEIVGEYGVSPGHFTDDTQMSLALTNSLLSRGTYIRSDALLAYRQWYLGLAARAPRGVGGTIRKALQYVEEKGMDRAFDDLSESGVRHRAHPCSPVDPMNDLYVGCGTAMRAVPLGAFFRTEQEIFKAATEDAYLTHASVEAAAGSFAVAWLVRCQIDSPCSNTHETVYRVMLALERHFPYTRVLAAIDLALTVAEAGSKSTRYLRPSSDVASGVGSAFAFFALVDDRERAMHALRRAIHLGGDTDTRAAIVGALLGARWGKDVFPYTLVSGVERSVELLKLDEQLVRRG